MLEGRLGPETSSGDLPPGRGLRGGGVWIGLVVILLVVAALSRLLAESEPAPPATNTPPPEESTPEPTVAPPTTAPRAERAQDAAGQGGSGVVAWPSGDQSVRLYLIGEGVLTEVNLARRAVRTVPFPASTPRGVFEVARQSSGSLVLYGGDADRVVSYGLDDGLVRGATAVEDLFVGEFRSGWYSDSLLVVSEGRIGELDPGGVWRWGPVPIVPQGRVLAALAEGRALFETADGLVAWGPGAAPEVLAPSGSRFLAAAGDYFAFTDPVGSLWVHSSLGTTAVARDSLPIDRWEITAAGVSHFGIVALALEPEGDLGPRLVMVSRDGVATIDDRVGAALDVIDERLVEVRWAPDGRWVFAASRDHEHIVAVAPNSGAAVVLPVRLPGHRGMAVVRVSASTP